MIRVSGRLHLLQRRVILSSAVTLRTKVIYPEFVGLDR
jgi:hypothetical protein